VAILNIGAISATDPFKSLVAELQAIDAEHGDG
jgi:hypothetical protein